MGTVLETAADYRGAAGCARERAALCDHGRGRARSTAARRCMAYVLRELGDWDRAVELCRELYADPAPRGRHAHRRRRRARLDPRLPRRLPRGARPLLRATCTPAAACGSCR